ncbi:MAG: NADH-quinone oxidoreductase subunit J [Acidimicrobiaceae bacterium]|jgi:NADH-quinone oxidoreductase subunit J|nr:NADH-quinone oxidoreductase subunit J [Acidimicrobiaceae bacterium]
MLALTTTWPDLLVFITAAALIVVGALGVISLTNPVHSALSLIITLFGVALSFLEQSADFLAAVEIIVYAGAIVVLILFVIMYLGVDRHPHDEVEPLVGQRVFAALGALVTVGGIITLMAKSHWVTGVMSASMNGTSLSSGQGEITQLGQSVFTTYLVAFEVTAALLIIAVLGAVQLARRDRESEVEQ